MKRYFLILIGIIMFVSLSYNGARAQVLTYKRDNAIQYATNWNGLPLKKEDKDNYKKESPHYNFDIYRCWNKNGISPSNRTSL
jgi:hypothetical protein